MAPQKRKHPHDAGPDPGADLSVPDAPPRRSTRQHPDGSIVEPEHQLRSGRVRASTIEKQSGTEVARTASRGRKADEQKSRPKTSSTDPAVATIPTRITRHNKVIAAIVSPVSPVSKENVRPPTPPDDRERRASQSKQSRHRAHTRSRSPPQLEPPPSSLSQSRTLVPISSQRPARPARPILKATSSELAPTASAIAITPKRTPSTKNQITKPPGTPRSDRNIDKIVFGKTCFKAWYPSYYGKEVLGDVSANVGGNAKMGGGKRDPPMLDRLYICPCCFKYSKEVVPWWKHVRYCEKKAFVPGTKIYTHPRHSDTVRIPYTNSTPASPMETLKGKGKSRGNESGQSTNDAIVGEGEWSVWEVDGEKDGLFCQNLSLFAKLFLDNKSVFFDVTGFNYFLLVYTPPASRKKPASPPIRIGSAPQAFEDSDNPSPISSNLQVDASTSLSPHPRPQIVGFFSKEQMSWDNNNLACILVFPPWQRKGLGALLMGVSYEISRREGILGGPEKPISELGRKGYKRFWAGEITRWILKLDVPTPSTEPTHTIRHTRREKEKEKEKDRGKDKAREQEGLIVDVEQCSRDTWIVSEDCLAVLREMGVVEEAGLGTPRDGRGTDVNGSGDSNIHGKEKEEKEPKLPLVPRVRIDKAAVRSWARENRIDLTRACDPNGFVEGYAIKDVEDNDKEE
ncbi:acyl-CoA N-acyltransferase [Xylaria digitata]|nr:acyl-CoA N-acyltransferase [Xylaria digitata]